MHQIRWAHAVNSIQALECAALQDLQFLEIDLRSDTPLLAHDPLSSSSSSAESLENWVNALRSLDYKFLGIKLDYKELCAVGPALRHTLPLLESQVVRELWLNADILQGPRGKRPVISLGELIDAAGGDQLLDSRIVLSLGWTTGNVNDEEKLRLGYTAEQIEDMEKCVEEILRGDRKVTLAVRGVDLMHSIHLFEELLQRNRRFSLTVWVGSESLDASDIEHVLIPKFGPERLYVDVPRWKPKN
jgi:hypothetical protein